MGKKRVYDDDDGRTIADMSNLAPRQNLFLPRLPPNWTKAQPPRPEPEPQAEDRPWEETGLSPEERRWYVLGAIRAGLLIALAFMAGLGLIVLLFYLFG